MEQEMNRVCEAEANLIEHRRDELLEIASAISDSQPADVDHSFIC